MNFVKKFDTILRRINEGKTGTVKASGFMEYKRQDETDEDCFLGKYLHMMIPGIGILATPKNSHDLFIKNSVTYNETPIVTQTAADIGRALRETNLIPAYVNTEKRIKIKVNGKECLYYPVSLSENGQTHYYIHARLFDQWFCEEAFLYYLEVRKHINDHDYVMHYLLMRAPFKGIYAAFILAKHNI